MIPVRCFTCGKVIGNKWEIFKNELDSGKNAKDVFVTINLQRYCCKRMFIGHVELIDKLLLYSTNNDKESKEI